MKTPTWGVVIGILMIVFGGCSVIGDFQAIYLPDKLEEEMGKAKTKMEEEREEALDSVALESMDSVTRAEAIEDAERVEEKRKELEEMINISDFTKTWIIRFGYIGIFVSLLYMTGGIFLLVKQKFSIMLAYTALIVSILCGGAQAAILTSGESSGAIALFAGVSQIVSIIIDIVLLAVIFASDKEAYTDLPPTRS
jgi:hypothetical protein